MLIEIFREQLHKLGYSGNEVRAQPIKTSQNLVLYYLVYASKHPLGDKIWKSVLRNGPTGQGELRGIG